ncbi:MAG: ubiquinol-cytochrome c reductase iron-sulfur subunit [Candidatus Latescibacteria bacterium]|nr:ubiquinol-cytochrome c reductase iron-sulfur subunit [Candidatus Latescibacterota bacterium]
MALNNRETRDGRTNDHHQNSSLRRGFIGKCLGFLGSLSFLTVLYPLIRYLEPPPEARGVSKVELDLADLPSGAARLVTYRGRPALVVNGENGIVAFNGVCSHLGCAVKWVMRDQEFACPCHGGRFDLQGRVIGGPPPEPLVPIAVSIHGDKVVLGA